MRFERKKWTPLTIVVEHPEEAEALHRILGLVEDNTEEQMLISLFYKLGEGLTSDSDRFSVTGSIIINRVEDFD